MDIKAQLPPLLGNKIEIYCHTTGRDPGALVTSALEKFLAKCSFLPEPVTYQLEDGEWTVLALEPVLETPDKNDRNLLLVRYYGTLELKTGGEYGMTALIALRGVTPQSSPLEILDAEWVSMRRD